MSDYSDMTFRHYYYQIVIFPLLIPTETGMNYLAILVLYLLSYNHFSLKYILSSSSQTHLPSLWLWFEGIMLLWVILESAKLLTFSIIIEYHAYDVYFTSDWLI